MRLRVERIAFQDKCTIGQLYIDGAKSGLYTLEDKYRECEDSPVEQWKVAGETAIPRGKYRVSIDHSEHFGRDLPHIEGVPGFLGVRIHPGNTDADTEGCILVGWVWNGGDFIGQSKEAFEWLFEQLKRAESIEIEVG